MTALHIPVTEILVYCWVGPARWSHDDTFINDDGEIWSWPSRQWAPVDYGSNSKHLLDLARPEVQALCTRRVAEVLKVPNGAGLLWFHQPDSESDEWYLVSDRDYLKGTAWTFGNAHGGKDSWEPGIHAGQWVRVPGMPPQGDPNAALLGLAATIRFFQDQGWL